MENDFIKITHAVYKILDFLPDSDPLKNRAKEKALTILENLTLIFSVEGWISLQKEKAKALVLDDIRVLENYLAIGKHQGWIDTANFLIITKQYHDIKKNIDPPTGLVRQSLEITPKPTHKKVKLVDEGSRTIVSSLGVVKNQARSGVGESNINEYSQRQKKILEILNKSQKAQVSDFIKELPDITKRTIRRDLDDLLKKRKIVRVGEWNQVFYQIL